MKFFCLILLLSSSIALGVSGEATFKAGTFDKFVSFNGHSAKVSGGKYVGGELGGTFSCDLTGFKTDDKDRDEDMQKEIFNSKKYPLAFLVMAPTAGPTFKGLLTFHGVTKPIAGKLKIKGKKAVATFTMKFTDFGVAVPTLLGVKPDETVDLTIKLNL